MSYIFFLIIGLICNVISVKNLIDDDNLRLPKTNYYYESSSFDPLNDAAIVGGSGTCNPEWKPKTIKNKSTEKFLTVTIEETTRRGTRPPTRKTVVYSKLAPQEEQNIGCQGCGGTSTGQLCVGYKILAAVYE